MSIYWILLIICLILIIIFLIAKIIIINISIKEIELNIEKILEDDSKCLITVSTNNRKLKRLASNLNLYIHEFRKQERKYKNGNQELQMVITNISHDLRTPLTAIKGYIDLIEIDKLNINQQKYLKIIGDKVDVLTNLTEQLYDYSKCLDLKDKIKKEKVCINEVLEEVLISYYELFKKKNITPIITINKDKIFKYFDRNMFIRVLENIISNALKYSEKNFKVNLLKNGKIIISNETKKLNLTNISKIFNRYYTLESGEKSSGVGLSIAKQLIELCGGNINAKYKNSNLIIEIEL